MYLFAAPWMVDHQAPLPMEFSRQEYWSGLPFPSPRHLPDPWIKPQSPTLQADSLPSEPPGKPSLFLRVTILDTSEKWNCAMLNSNQYWGCKEQRALFGIPQNCPFQCSCLENPWTEGPVGCNLLGNYEQLVYEQHSHAELQLRTHRFQ